MDFMDLNLQKEQFSIAYLRAVAATAGFAVSPPGVDDDSVDYTIAVRGGSGTIRSPRLDIQLKCTAAPLAAGADLRYALKKKNCDDLRGDAFMVPRLLIVVRVPELTQDWLRQSENELAMRHCGYWVSLRGKPDMTNETTVTVSVPRSNVLTVDALRELMRRIGEEDIP
jgi:hypothetical protein